MILEAVATAIYLHNTTKKISKASENLDLGLDQGTLTLLVP